MATDPEAARAVFQSGIRMEMYGYNVELKSALANSEIGQIVHGANGPYTTAFAMSGMSHKPGEPIYYGPAIATLGLATPEIFTYERHNIFIETKSDICRGRVVPLTMYTPLGHPKDTKVAMDLEEIIYVFLTIFLYLPKCPQSLILSALRAFCFCGKAHIPRSIFLYFRYQSWLKSW